MNDQERFQGYITQIFGSGAVPATAAQGALADTALQSVPTASAGTLGVIKVGSGLTITDGVLSVSGGSYTLPIAQTGTLGGIQPSDDINVDSGTGAATVATGNQAGAIPRIGTLGLLDLGSAAINLNVGGGISTSENGFVDTNGAGQINFGADGTRTVITGTATANRAVSFPDEDGTLATREYADSLVVGMLDDRGNYDASGNTFPASGGSGTAGAVLKGDLWTVSVAGTLGGAAVTAGDVLRALIDTPDQTAANWVVTENNLGYVPQNTAGTLALGGFSGITGTLAIANVAAETATRLATAFNGGTEDTSAADTDRLAVTSPAGGWMSLTTLWTWITGKLSAAFYRPLIVKKSTAQIDVTSSITFVNITGLTGYTLEANTTYRVEFFGEVTAGASGGYKIAITSTQAFKHTTSGTQGLGGFWPTGGTAGAPFQLSSTQIQINSRTAASTALPVVTIAIITTGANAPTIDFQFAQNSSNATTSSLLTGAVGSFTKLI